MNPAELSVHYQKCISFFDEAKNHYKEKYLGLYDKIRADRLQNSRIGEIANPEHIEAVFSTNEHAVEPRSISEKLTTALLTHSSIQLLLETKVDSVSRKGSKLIVRSTKNGVRTANEYTDVINATWNGLLEIDKTMNIAPPNSWSYRYKFGNKVFIPLGSSCLPSCTLVQGPYGDTVNFRERGMFLSWYPIGRTGWSEDLRPPEWDQIYTESERIDVFERSFTELTKRIPALAHLKFTKDLVKPVGGVIYALGNTDVDDYESQLHTRHEVGIRSFDNYHSVNTGKYTLIPYLGLKMADRIEGID